MVWSHVNKQGTHQTRFFLRSLQEISSLFPPGYKAGLPPVTWEFSVEKGGTQSDPPVLWLDWRGILVSMIHFWEIGQQNIREILLWGPSITCIWKYLACQGITFWEIVFLRPNSLSFYRSLSLLIKVLFYLVFLAFSDRKETCS